MPESDIDELFSRAKEVGYELTVDLDKQTVSDSSGFERSFEVDPSRRHNLLHGLDDIGQTLQHEDKITTYENARSW